MGSSALVMPPLPSDPAPPPQGAPWQDATAILASSTGAGGANRARVGGIKAEHERRPSVAQPLRPSAPLKAHLGGRAG